MSARTWTLVFDKFGRPLTENEAHRLHFRQVAAVRKGYRHTATLMARQARIPKLARVTIEVTGRYPNRRNLPDPGALAPAAKPIIDGIVDAGVIPDDSGTYVDAITYYAPVVGVGEPALILTITEVTE